jgi:hypothetical protein
MHQLKNTEFIVDKNGNRKKVILEYNDFIKLIDLIEDQEDSKKIRKTLDEPEIPLSAYKREKKLV